MILVHLIYYVLMRKITRSFMSVVAFIKQEQGRKKRVKDA